MRVGAKVWFIEENQIFFGIINEDFDCHFSISSKKQQHFVAKYRVFKDKKDAEDRLKTENKTKPNVLIRMYDMFFGV